MKIQNNDKNFWEKLRQHRSIELAELKQMKLVQSAMIYILGRFG